MKKRTLLIIALGVIILGCAGIVYSAIGDVWNIPKAWRITSSGVLQPTSDNTASAPLDLNSADITEVGSLDVDDLLISGLTASKPVFTDASKNITSAGTLAMDQGGTGADLTNDPGGVPYCASSVMAILADGAAGKFLQSGGTSAPAWEKVDLASDLDVTGTLDVPNGGTGATSFTQGGILLGQDTATVTAMAVLGNGAIIVGDGTTDPVALSAFSSSIGTLNVTYGGTGLASITAHKLIVGNETDAVTQLGIGTDGQLLVGSSSADPVFATLTADDGLETTTGAGTLEIDLDLKANGGTVIESDELAIDLGAISITGTLAVTDGGTGAVALTNNCVLVGSGTDAVTAIGAGTNNQVLVATTGSDPAFAALTDAEIPAILTLSGSTIDNSVIGGSVSADATIATGTVQDLVVETTASFTGATIDNLGTVTTADINAGNLDNVAIGASVSNDATINDLIAHTLDIIGSASFTGATIDNLGAVATADINGGSLDGATIGAAVSADATIATGTIQDLVVETTASFTGATIDNLGTVTTADIDGGTWQGTIDGSWTAAGQTCADIGTVTTGDVTINTLSGTAGEIVGSDGEVNAARVEDKFLRNDAGDITSGFITQNTNQKAVVTHESAAQAIERGTETLSGGTIVVTFDTAFIAVPIVVPGYAAAHTVVTGDSVLYVHDTTTVTCSITGAADIDVNWIAAGNAE